MFFDWGFLTDLYILGVRNHQNHVYIKCPYVSPVYHRKFYEVMYRNENCFWACVWLWPVLLSLIWKYFAKTGRCNSGFLCHFNYYTIKKCMMLSKEFNEISYLCFWLRQTDLSWISKHSSRKGCCNRDFLLCSRFFIVLM